MKNFLKLILAILICELVGVVGGFFTVSSIPGWYAGLNKPFFSPPNWIFGPVWTLLYFLMGVSLFLIWKKGFKKKENKFALKIFGSQLILNLFWSIIFFNLKMPELAFIEVVFLWILIAKTIQAFYKISRTAALILIPYLLWVSFASILNLAIALLN